MENDTNPRYDVACDAFGCPVLSPNAEIFDACQDPRSFLSFLDRPRPPVAPSGTKEAREELCRARAVYKEWLSDDQRKNLDFAGLLVRLEATWKQEGRRFEGQKDAEAYLAERNWTWTDPKMSGTYKQKFLRVARKIPDETARSGRASFNLLADVATVESRPCLAMLCNHLDTHKPGVIRRGIKAAAKAWAQGRGDRRALRAAGKAMFDDRGPAALRPWFKGVNKLVKTVLTVATRGEKEKGAAAAGPAPKEDRRYPRKAPPEQEQEQGQQQNQTQQQNQAQKQVAEQNQKQVAEQNQKQVAEQISKSVSEAAARPTESTAATASDPVPPAPFGDWGEPGENEPAPIRPEAAPRPEAVLPTQHFVATSYPYGNPDPTASERLAVEIITLATQTFRASVPVL